MGKVNQPLGSGLVSVVIPCFNYGHFLAETLESVSHQTYQKWECIIVNDGSTDSTAEVANQFIARDNRFRLFNQENRGLSAARNSGIKRSGGEFIQFLDADDLIAVEKLADQVAFLNRYPDVDVVYGEIEYFLDNSHEDMESLRSVPSDAWTRQTTACGEGVLEHLLINNITVVSSPLIRAALVDDGIRFDESLRCLEDWAFWIECALHGACFSFQPGTGPVTKIRWHPSSMSHDTGRMVATAIRLREQYHNRLPTQSLKSLNSERCARDAWRQLKSRLSSTHQPISSSFSDLARKIVHGYFLTCRRIALRLVHS